MHTCIRISGSNLIGCLLSCVCVFTHELWSLMQIKRDSFELWKEKIKKSTDGSHWKLFSASWQRFCNSAELHLTNHRCSSKTFPRVAVKNAASYHVAPEHLPSVYTVDLVSVKATADDNISVHVRRDFVQRAWGRSHPGPGNAHQDRTFSICIDLQ